MMTAMPSHKFMRCLRAALALSVGILLASPALAQDETTLVYAEPTSGRIGAGENDEYTFEAAEGDRPIILMTAVRGDIDPFLQLYDSRGRLIAEDDDGAGKRDAQIDDLVLADAGTYTVRATNNGGDMGDYGLIVNEATRIISYHGGGVVANVPGGGLLASPGVQNYELTQPLPSNDITYSILNELPGFSFDEMQTVIREAFAAWAVNTPLNFTEVQGDQATIVISFAGIDGSSNVLGQACPPSSPCAGQVEFDIDENWVLREPQYYDSISLLAVATHEFGHTLGLLHSNDPAALMYPQYSPYNLQPAEDDIAGVQRLYGRGQGTVLNPTPQPGSGTDAGSAEAVQGTISGAEYVHFWDFDVAANEPVTITMQAASGGLDSFLVLLDANNNVLAFDDDGGSAATGGRLDAQIRNISLPQSGTYTVAATRYLQVQGNSEGTYTLSLTYGLIAEPNPATPASAPGGSVNGGVRVSRGDQTSLSSSTPLEGVLEGSFADSLTPGVQTLTGMIDPAQTYAWSHTWCATSTQFLNTSLRNMTMAFSINGRETDASNITRVTSERDGLFCATDFILVSGFEGNRIRLSVTMRLSAPAFDGLNVYAAGDYVYVYDLAIQ